MYYALLYETVPDYVRRREPYRAEHLALAQRAHREGRLILAGAFNPPNGALLVFRANGASEVEKFVREDPYVRNGLVTSWQVREWTVVIGADAP
jgi:uncharacterized protein YciI